LSGCCYYVILSLRRSVSNTLNKASALGNGRLDVLKTGGVLVTTILVGVHGLVSSDVRHVLHLSVVLERSLGADNDLGISHCEMCVVALTRLVMRRVVACDELGFARLNGLY
jgi:hypothetical protein